MSSIILCVTEGEKTEVKVLERLQAEFLDQPIEIIRFGTNIYQLYRKVKDEDIEFLTTYEILQEISQERRGKRDDAEDVPTRHREEKRTRPAAAQWQL